jgi:hypothetical protein
VKADPCLRRELLKAHQMVFMSHRRTTLKPTVSTGVLLVFLTLSGSAWCQALPRVEQQFCSAFAVFREALKQAHAVSIDNSPRRQRQLRQAALVAAKEFKQSAGWRSSSQAVKGWLSDLHSIAETTAWGHHVGVAVKLPCEDVIIGVPELAVHRWSVSSIDPIEASCSPADPYIGSDKSSFANLKKLSVGQESPSPVNFVRFLIL